MPTDQLFYIGRQLVRCLIRRGDDDGQGIGTPYYVVMLMRERRVAGSLLNLIGESCLGETPTEIDAAVIKGGDIMGRKRKVGIVGLQKK